MAPRSRTCASASIAEPGHAKVRVYNPQIEQHGWQSTHTIVEVVTDDMPFLVDSVSMALNRLGLLIHLTIHPVLPVRRDADGMLEAVLDAASGDGGEPTFESFMHVEVDRQSDLERLDRIRTELEHTLGDVRAAVEDWRPMLGKIDTALADLKHGARAIDAADLEEAQAFLAWIADNHFTFLGYGCYDLIRDQGGDQLRRVEGSALGLLRRQGPASATSRSFAALPAEIRRRARDPAPLVITKANARSTVHRPVYLDFIGVQRFDPKGKVIGEHRFLGLFTSAAYNRNPRHIPLLRHKVERVMQRANLPPAGHSGKALANILETHPRDELFQMSEEELFQVAQEILHLQERQKIRLFLRRDPFARFVSCLVYVPRERYNTEIRRRFQEILRQALGGTEVEYQAQFSESILARIQFIVRTPDGIPADLDAAELEARLVEAARSWTDRLYDALIDAHGEEEGTRLLTAYGSAMPAGYQAQVTAREAVPDIDRLEQLARGETDLAMSLYRSLEHAGGMLCLKLARKDHTIALSDVLPVLENMGLRVIQEQPYEFVTARGERFWLHDFRVQPIEALDLDIDQVRGAFQDAFAHVWHGEVESDGFNQLVLHGLDWRADHGAARLLQVSPADRHSVQPGLHGADARPQSGAGAPGGAAVRGQVRSRLHRRPPGPARRARGGVPRRPGCGRQPRRGPHPQALHASRSGDAAHQLLPARAGRRAVQAVPVAQDRSGGSAGDAAAAAGVRDLRLRAAHRRRAPARRQGGARRHPVVGPARGLPHRGARPDEGADGEELRHRAGRGEGRVRGQAAAARRRPGGAPGRGGRVLPDPDPRHAGPDRQSRRRSDRAARARGPLRRRRSVSGGRRRQGHRHLLRHRERDQPGVRPLAG